jgi:hypothetical protein
MHSAMSEQRNRREIVEDLVHLRRPPEELRSELKLFPWDSEELVVMTPADAIGVLTRATGGAISLEQVGEWADAIEMRDDIGLDPDEPLREMIYELASPELEGPITMAKLQKWVMELSPLT